MLPKQSRITRKEFPALISSRNFYHSDHFVLRAAPSRDNKCHVGVSVFKKISKKAVTRNAIRRRVYSVIYKELKNVKPNLILIVAKAGAEKIKGENLENEIKILLTKGKCL